MGKHNLAYDLSKYENANYKQDEEKVKINMIRQKNASQGSAPKVIALTLSAGLLMGAVIYAKVEQAALHTDISSQTKYVDILRSENVRMKSEIEGKSSIKAVEEYAENVLGMQKIDKSQIDYITIENGNVIDIPDNNDNVFIKVKNAFSDFLEYIRG